MILAKILLPLLFIFIIFTGCSSRDEDEYNKPAMYWYSKIIENISIGNLDKADNYYSSLQGEHIGSPLLREATLILAIVHMQNDEYILSQHFLDEYIKRYANQNEKEYLEYMSIKAKYLALPHPRRDQAAIDEAIQASKEYKAKYPNSVYYPFVDMMLTKQYLARATLNESIASLYDRIDKPTSAKFYRDLQKQPWIKWDQVDRENNPWYRTWIEGDGTSSWYDFMIPKTQSVVSRNSSQSDVSKNSSQSDGTSNWYDFMRPKTQNDVSRDSSQSDISKNSSQSDGTSSWYDYIIAKAQSVVSRNSSQSDENVTNNGVKR